MFGHTGSIGDEHRLCKPRSKPSSKPEALNRRWRTPRPLNPFILYRRERHQEVLQKHQEISNNSVSKIVGRMWGAEPPYVKQIFSERSEESKRLHEAKHPNYKFNPRKNKPKRLTDEYEDALE
ncbi:high mobility group box domain-containing protein [Fimicolochytrium jonesii]|uniref:high mobility group box domain-containing protein n=1 Tax=Fimicolochytrium jonesii TaxID=1396493 RepID=UPI0022FE474E|nr:high mobility group box domain-containing protein [Fimicolochytrium jonesii]KAI8815516.1 high mobility group box domain-containing protein [Fimicolochytrium jonesii]